MGEGTDVLRRISYIEPSWVKAFARMIPFPKDTKDCNLFSVAFYGFFIFFLSIANLKDVCYNSGEMKTCFRYGGREEWRN